MAREESNRENLLREATALVERVELVPHVSDSSYTANILGEAHIVAGFRANGALSVFFGEDPVYQFNAVGELRRAYCDGMLLKAIRGRLASLERVRTRNEVQLIRHELTENEHATFLSRMADHMQELAALLNGNRFQIVGQVPLSADVLGRLRLWLARDDQWPVAARPNA